MGDRRGLEFKGVGRRQGGRLGRRKKFEMADE